MAVALGGLALVVAARGGDGSRDAAVTVDDSGSDSSGVEVGQDGDGDSSWPGLTEDLQAAAGGASVRLLDFSEIDQVGSVCAEGVEGALPRTILVSEGESALLDEDLITQLEVDGDVAYGDLDRDGQDEAVVHTVCAYGANGAQDSIQVWSVEGGAPAVKASVGEPPESITGRFPPAVKSVALENGAIAVTWTHYADDDPNCCPSRQTTVRYQLVGDDLMVVGQPETSAAG